MVDVASLRHLIAMGLAQARLPPELNALRELPNLVKTVEVRANLSRSAPSDLILTANNEADARKIITLFDGVKQQMAANIVAKAQEALASDDPIEQASGRYSLRMARMMDERVQLERQADQIILFRTDLTTAGGNPMAATAVIGTLVALLLPAVQAAREAARRNQSMNNLKQIMLALHNHHDVRKAFPPQANVGDDGKPLLSWRVHILPYLEQQALYQQFHLDEPWNSEYNKKLIEQMPPLYIHPGSKLTANQGKTNYLGVQGEKFLFSGKSEGRGIREITDGTSNTIAIVQADDDHAVIWTKPEDYEPGKNDPDQGLGGLAGDIFLAAFCDGSVRAVSKQIDQGVLRALFTIDGGEVIPQGF
jgi:type II secretory pathway pseudopilin PulG